MGHEPLNSTRPEGGAAGCSAGALESELPRAGKVQMDFSLALERRGSESAVLVLAGELDLLNAPAIEDALSAEARNLTVDLRLVSFIDARTLGLLLDASRRRQASGGQLLVLVGPQTPMTGFRATGLDRILAIRRPDTQRRNIASCTARSERTSSSLPPHTTLKGRNNHGNSGSN